ncbi:MAG TPA: hypothetical protein VIL85_21120 [Thermomicrobiales bacterium]|jgi:hypothetical protein
MFERAAQVNARFTAGTCKPDDVVAALEGLGLKSNQITVLSRPAPVAAPASAGWLGRVKGMFGGGQPAAAAPAATPELQIIVHMGQDGTLSEPVRELFQRFGATGIEHFAAAHSPNRAFGPAGAGTDSAETK